MSKIPSRARKALLAAALLALGLTAFPQLSARAQSVVEPVTPPTPIPFPGLRLERAWARQQRLYDRMSYMFEHTQQRLDRAHELIDQAKANGKDTTALQAGLDALADAVKEARPVFESVKGLIASHKGFDTGGKVTDRELAAGTVQAMAEKLKEVRDILLNPARLLRDALRDFRESNRPN